MDLMIFASETNLRHFKVSLVQAPRWVGKTARQKNAENRARTKEKGTQARFFAACALSVFARLHRPKAWHRLY